ncbi:ribonuclease III [Chloroflexota bacterium]
MASLKKLINGLGINPTDKALLVQALVHTSYVNEHPRLAVVSNERLEFLGDAVLGLVVAEFLYARFPSMAEGDMSKIRAVVVSSGTLVKVAQDLRLGEYLFLGKGEEKSGGRTKPANLARALEAVIGAVFLDAGISGARGLVLRLLEDEISLATGTGGHTDPKSSLQELLHSSGKPMPEYRVVGEDGPAHQKVFQMEVVIGGIVMGKGQANTKKLAEMQAAQQALERL